MTGPAAAGRRAWLAAAATLWALPAQAALDVRAFGARGDSRHDDTAALQRALAALQPGQTLRFAPGTYRHATRLVVATPGVRLAGEGATLVATEPADQALLLQADGIEVAGFTLHAVTDRRRDAPWESRIAAWREGRVPLKDIRIVGNRIVEHGPPGSAGANSSGSAAIFVHRTHGFVVADNEVRRPLSDAIHVTGGSRDGQVLRNTVRESGDDMIAVVSYLRGSEPARANAAAVAATLDERRALRLVQRVLVADNDLAGNYWGRGISVVGGTDVSILRNRVDACTHAAAVYLAREANYGTFGVERVRVQDNRLTRVQTGSPAYSVLPPERRGRRTGHGAVELVAWLDDDEARLPALVQALGIRDVEVLDNTIAEVATAGVRVGDRWGAAARPGAPVRRVRIAGNRFGQIGGEAVTRFNAADPEAAAACDDNRLDGQPLAPRGCAPALLDVTPPERPRAGSR